ncbi:MAG TPA: GGDEF domain-containing protein [Phycisphaerales bacterium]|nr:GGDEF domain-containing protein [Phycisphaerales bacterium]
MSNTRHSRGVCIFAGSFDEQLISGMDQSVKSVNSIYDAIGELATCSASDLVEAVVVDDTLIESNPKASIDALRRVDPTAVIVVASETNNHTSADANIAKNTTAMRLLSAIANVKSQPIMSNPACDIDLDEVLGISDETQLETDSSSLGDIDLVRSLMHAPINFKNTLVDLLKQQTGWSYCAFVDDNSCAPQTAKTTPLRYGHEEHGVLAAIGATSADLTRWGRWAACWLDLARRQQNLKLLAYQDELSGAWNRRFLHTCLTKELKIARDSRRHLTVMIFDIDDFKHYNDRWGHDAGDEIIKEIVKLLRTIIRKGDHVCRIGGDEFAVLFCDPEPPREPGSNHPTTIEILAKRFREQVQEAHFPKLGNEATGVLSISGGLATFPWDAMDVDTLLLKADQRLLQSKRQGKNSITIGNKE